MSTKNIQSNLISFNSPLRVETGENDRDSPGSNPFDTLSQIADNSNIPDIQNDPFYLLRADIDDCGRESLGLLHLDVENMKFDDGKWLVPEIQVDTENILQISKENLTSEFNTAFLYSYRSNKLSAASNIPSSTSSFPEGFESWDLSKISSLSLAERIYPDSFSVLNKGFRNDQSESSVIADILKDRRCTFSKNGLRHQRARIHSLPNVLQTSDEKFDDKKLANPYLNSFRKSESLFKKSFTLPQVSKVEEVEDNEFNDSVFIEAKHVAAKMADNSILDLADGELYLLDCTPQPDLMNISDYKDEKSVENCTENVFKTVDKMIPNVKDQQSDIPEKEKSLEDHNNKTVNSTNSNNSLGRSEQNVSEVLHHDSKKLSTSRLSQCSNNSKSKDAKSLLHELSEILYSENRSDQQKSEGQNLLSSLADILYCDERSVREESEDSGHSSINQDILPTNKEEIGINTKINAEEEAKPLDLSMSKRRRDSSSVECCNGATSKIMCNNTVDGCKDEIIVSNDSKNLSSLKTNISNLSAMGKLKPKKIDKKVIPEKGPLKAMIPVGNMSKMKGANKSGRVSSTPTKNNQYTSGSKIKRTSTPKTDSKPQPVAQSTPDTSSRGIPTTSQLRQRRLEAPVSPLTRANSVENESVTELNAKNRSGSAPNLSVKNTSKLGSTENMFRRRSASEIKISKDAYKCKRSNTMDKDSGITKTVSYVRQNIEKFKSPIGAVAKPMGSGRSTQSKPATLVQRNRSLTPSGIKPCNLANKSRNSSGKENIHK